MEPTDKRLYFAPMEGIAGYMYRNIHRKYFGGADKYFSPFLSPNNSLRFTPKEMADIAPENNQTLCLVPQILANQSEVFLWTAREMEERGYQEVNLNLGCPSGTVVAKGRGAGFLARPEELDRFLDAVFTGTKLSISVKTRLGLEQEAEFERLLAIFNQYPICELIIHPRVRTDYYRGTPRREAFRQALGESRIPVVYNGDLFTAEDVWGFREEVSGLMLGRGVIANPGLFRELHRGQAMTKEELWNFLEELREAYLEKMGPEPVLFKMKELWFYMGHLFTDSARCMKKVKKSRRLSDYEAAVREIFAVQELIPGAGFPGTP